MNIAVYLKGTKVTYTKCMLIHSVSLSLSLGHCFRSDSTSFPLSYLFHILAISNLLSYSYAVNSQANRKHIQPNALVISEWQSLSAFGAHKYTKAICVYAITETANFESILLCSDRERWETASHHHVYVHFRLQHKRRHTHTRVTRKGAQ